MAAAGAGELTEPEKRLRVFDMETALCIASVAGCPTHDGLGNLLPSVWCRHEADVAQSTSVLLESADLRKILLEQLRAHMERRQDLILESEDTEALVQWIITFSQDWETKYREKQNQKYDISQNIYAAMLETYHYVHVEMDRALAQGGAIGRRPFTTPSIPGCSVTRGPSSGCCFGDHGSTASCAGWPADCCRRGTCATDRAPIRQKCSGMT